MKWLRNAFARKATRPTKSTRPNAFRPNLEALDARDLPSVSSVLTAGGLNSFVVDSGNNLLFGMNGAAPTVAIAGTTTTGFLFTPQNTAIATYAIAYPDAQNATLR